MRNRISWASLACCLLLFAWNAPAAEPLLGTWQLDHQELNGEKKETHSVTLRVTPDGDKLLFAFSVPVNNIDFVSMSYSAKLDGTETDVKNARGMKVGTAQVTRDGSSKYKLVLKGETRPESDGRIIVSSDGNTLTSESETKLGTQTQRLVQTFSRH